ncbi:hypothetical protein [Mycolicibacterium thermoresistibile]
MAFGKRAPASTDDDAGGDAADTSDPTDDRAAADIQPDEAMALAEEAEAKAAEAEAAAAAARARAEAARLRRQAARSKVPDTDGDEVTDEAAGEAEETEPAPAEVSDPTTAETSESDPPARKRIRVRWGTVASAAAIVVIAALLATSGYLIWHHQQAEAEKQRAAEFAAAARQGVVSLMSLDFNRAEEDVQRIIDNSTGQFRDDFESAAEDFANVAKEAQVITDVAVNATAVESMTEDSAEVLVAATSSVTNAAGAEQDPRSWRLFVSVTRDDGQLKMSKVEFVP